MSKELITAWIFIGIGWTLYFITALELFINEVQLWLYICQILCWNISAIALFAGAMKLRQDSQGIEAYRQRIEELETKIEELETKKINREQFMEKLELENKITELEAQIVELKKELQKELQKGTKTDPTKYEFWKPDREDGYFKADYDGNVCAFYWHEDNTDLLYYQSGLIYETAEQAEYEANCMKYKHLYRRYIQEHTEPLDWNNEEQKKYFAFWDYEDNVIDFNWNDSYRYAGVEHASDEQVIRDAIKFVGEENFLRFVLEVKE